MRFIAPKVLIARATSYLSSNLVVAAELTIMSISSHISFFNCVSLIPKFSNETSPGTATILSNVELMFEPVLSLRTLKNLLLMICRIKVMGVG